MDLAAEAIALILESTDNEYLSRRIVAGLTEKYLLDA